MLGSWFKQGSATSQLNTSTTPFRRSRVFECSPKISTVPRRTDAPTERSCHTLWTAWVRCPCRRGERPVSALGASRGRVSKFENFACECGPCCRSRIRVSVYRTAAGGGGRAGGPVARGGFVAAAIAVTVHETRRRARAGRVQVARAEIPIPGGAGGGRILRSRYVYTSSAIYTRAVVCPRSTTHTPCLARQVSALQEPGACALTRPRCICICTHYASRGPGPPHSRRECTRGFSRASCEVGHTQ